MSDPVNHPDHYKWHPSGVECIRITEHFNFNVGNAIKYLWRAGWKDSNTHIEDLEKAIWYIQNEIGLLKAKALHPATKPTGESPVKAVRDAHENAIAFQKDIPKWKCNWCNKWARGDVPHVCPAYNEPTNGPFAGLDHP